MKIAIIGAGVSGLVAADALRARHDITVYEAAAHLGGHNLAVPVETRAGVVEVDTGFVVFNRTTYPEFCRLLERLGVESRPTSMGFSVSDPARDLEYAGESLDGLFAQRRNLLRPSFLRLVADVMRFNRVAPALVERLGDRATLAELCDAARVSDAFRDGYLVPMCAAIWSTDERRTLGFPARFFVRFFANHGLLEPPSRQLPWRVVAGGSTRYVEALTRPFRDRIRRATPVRQVRRVPGGVEVVTADGAERYDEVVLATHADQSLRLIERPTALEREVLGAFPYQANDAVLHADTRLLPRRRRAWASWNYHVPADRARPVMVTYDMSRLQGLDTERPLLVTLNDAGAVEPGRIVRRLRFEHPVFTLESIGAQRRHAEVSGADRLHFCGAYWRNGFHEDGVVSGLAVARALLRGGVAA